MKHGLLHATHSCCCCCCGSTLLLVEAEGLPLLCPSKAWEFSEIKQGLELSKKSWLCLTILQQQTEQKAKSRK